MIANRFNSYEKSPSGNKKTSLFRVFHLLGIALLLATLLAATTRSARAGATLVVNLVNEGSDANPGDGFCALASGACTLRAAIQEANAHPGADAITFNLPGSGIHVMSISAGPLPAITDPLTLDGTSQPNCVVPCIVLSGALVGGANNGITLQTGSSTVKGFIITSWTGGRGIMISGDSNQVQSNEIGFWRGNPTLLPNGEGIIIGGSNNLIGGGLAEQRNVISGNTFAGIVIANGCCAVSSSNTIWNNRIGTNSAGTSALGNHSAGVILYDLADGTAFYNNQISGNLGWGIEMAGATNTWIRGNKIGTNAAGTGALGNGLGGILITAGANTSNIGGPSSGQRNTIAFNRGVGISVITTGAINNRLERNSIFANTGMGINLGPAGVTANDLRDPDAGPNLTQNFPVLTSASGASHVITGRLNSMAAHAYTLEFFASPAGTCDPSGHGEGRRFLGSLVVTTNAAGNVNFNFTTPGAFSPVEAITATATDGWGSTSEFSLCRIAK